ncbi:hypothetical protein XCR_2717 [Xanthomonas campestris pv. raphani 756C]|nr:hypothetical protein XCR_2717 [Xanthomonas campestris pv. raphani 756C]
MLPSTARGRLARNARRKCGNPHNRQPDSQPRVCARIGVGPRLLRDRQMRPPR